MDTHPAGPGTVPPARPGVHLSATVADSDLSTSTILDAAGAPGIDASEEGLTLVPDVTYATRTRADGGALPLRLDVFTHDDGGPRPLAVFVSGGGFVVSPKAMARDHRAYVARAGLTSGTAEFASGGHLDQSSDVDAVVDKFGPSALADIAEDFDDASRESPSFLLFYGSTDVMISPSQTLRLHNALREAGAASERLVLPGAGHGDPAIGAAWSSTAAIDPIVEFFRRSLR
jgi:acetyl esterase/lipase